MDIFIRNVPENRSENDLKRFLRPHLNRVGVPDCIVDKPKNKDIAFVSVADSSKASRFLAWHGRGSLASAPLLMEKGAIVMTKSNKPISPLKLKALRRTEEHQKNLKNPHKSDQRGVKSSERAGYRKCTFEFDVLQCGHWHYAQSVCCFATEYRDETGGVIAFGGNSLVILLGRNPLESPKCRMDVQYLQVDNINLEPGSDASITLSLTEAPKISRVGSETLSERLSGMSLSETKRQLKRATGISHEHIRAAGISLVYRLKLINRHEMTSIRLSLRSARNAPSVLNLDTEVISPTTSMKVSFDILQKTLSDPLGYGHLPFKILFQLARLARNTYLHPNEVVNMIPAVKGLFRDHGLVPVVDSLKRISDHLPVRGPYVRASVFSLRELTARLEELIATYCERDSVFDVEGRHDHLVLVHRALVTPSGLYLEGPTLESGNRVLRRYHDYSDYFLRVQFADEDGFPVQYDSRWPPENIYHDRFRKMLETPINIAGRNFGFLGFSHSSLRSQSCWFMAPFVQDLSLIHAKEVIGQLGDFSAFRSPAKCAARIGQAFSETYSSVAITNENLILVKDVERNGRVFSDGCGTLSLGLLRKIWPAYSSARKRQSKPTLLQIRFAGAKGMISLDTRIEGEKLCLRPSMLKFDGSKSWDIEICGANFRALPMYLNRQFVKILEDLGTPAQAFLDLQAEQVRTIKRMTQAYVNAALALELNHWCGAQRLPSLLRMLSRIGVDPDDDGFLKEIIDICALAQLRELKYRARIHIEKGCTLFGIMDETDFLNEGEVCVNMGKRELQIDTEKVMITRSPQMHPGDVQKVRVVEPPADSPLRKLQHCVIFSSKGKRDLPSQLSGGDLDGDLYNIIFDPSLYPKKFAEPADYPRPEAIDIGHEVGIGDMADFFVNFMENDKLGMICVNHLQLADEHTAGTLHPDCIKLAEMASTAVDFSKTGIPVDMHGSPRINGRVKPDFLAPGPRLIMQSSRLTVMDDGQDDDDDDDTLRDLLPRSGVRFYDSPKVLGKLYRAIDESKFLQELQDSHVHLAGHHNGGERSIIDRLWVYIKRESRTLQWDHHREEAGEIMESYYQNLIDICNSYSVSHKFPLSEAEVFSNNILGASSGRASRQARELGRAMKERWDRDIAYTRQQVLGRRWEGAEDGGDDEEGGAGLRSDEALPRAIACFAVAVEGGPYRTRLGGQRTVLRSWLYVVAEMVLWELWKWKGTLAAMAP